MAQRKNTSSNPSNHRAVEYRAIGELMPHAGNARTHSPTQRRKMQRSLKRFGMPNPILIDDAGNVVAGNLRLEAARANGDTHVPVLVLDMMSEADRRAYIIADNRTARSDTSRPHHKRSCLALLRCLTLRSSPPSRATLFAGTLTYPVDHPDGAGQRLTRRACLLVGVFAFSRKLECRIRRFPDCCLPGDFQG